MIDFLIYLGVYIVGCWASYFYVRWKDTWLGGEDLLYIVVWPISGVFIFLAVLLIGVPEFAYRKLFKEDSND